MAYIPPEKVHGPNIKAAILLLAKDVLKESGASGAVIDCKFEIRPGSDSLIIRMQVSNDSRMERIDSAPPRPKGEGLTSDAENSVRQIIKDQPNKGEDHV